MQAVYHVSRDSRILLQYATYNGVHYSEFRNDKDVPRFGHELKPLIVGIPLSIEPALERIFLVYPFPVRKVTEIDISARFDAEDMKYFELVYDVPLEAESFPFLLQENRITYRRGSFDCVRLIFQQKSQLLLEFRDLARIRAGHRLAHCATQDCFQQFFQPLRLIDGQIPPQKLTERRQTPKAALNYCLRALGRTRVV